VAWHIEELIDYLCVLFMRDGVIRLPRRIILHHLDLERNAGGSKGS
jgi:hypothetical protein